MNIIQDTFTLYRNISTIVIMFESEQMQTIVVNEADVTENYAANWLYPKYETKLYIQVKLNYRLYNLFILGISCIPRWKL